MQIGDDWHDEVTEPTFRRGLVLKLMGMGADAPLPTGIDREVDELIPIAEKAIDIRFRYRFFESVKINDQTVTLINENVVFRSTDLANCFDGCHSVVIVAITIGFGLDELATRMSGDNRVLGQLIVDAIGSAVVETAVSKLYKGLATEIQKREYRTTKRYSPGYGDFGLHYQPIVVKLAGGSEIGIELNDNNLMSPSKSITALFGIGDS